MAEEQPPAKKAVKRVVKKTVVRPATARPTNTVRYGRPVSTTAKARAASASTSKPAAVASPGVGAKAASRVGAAGRQLSSRGAAGASGIAEAAGSATRATGTFLLDRFDALRAWRIPHLHPFLAAAITGVVVGLVAVGLGLAANAAFTELRGVATGGGRWGSLTFVVVAFIAFGLGELLLSAFGSAQARLISFLGVVLAIVAIMGLFLEASSSAWAFVIVPALGAVTYMAANWLLELAESTSTLPE